MDTNLEFLLEELRTRSGVIWGDFSGNPNENPTPVTENAPNDITWLVETSTATPSIWLKGGGSWIVIGTDLSSSIAAAQQALADTVVAKDVTLLAKTAAESARDAAIIGAGVYVDEPTGRAAVADGVAFKVQGSGDVAAYEYRRVNSGSSTLIATYPAAAAVSAIGFRATRIEQETAKYTGTDDLVPLVTDSAGSVLLGVYKTTGTVFVAGALDETVVTEVLGQFGFAKYIGDGPVYPVVTDASGRVLLGVDREDGVLVGPALDGAIVAPALDPVPLAVPLIGKAVNHVIFYGQSLSVGAAAGSLISTTQPYSNITFNGGPRAWNGTTWDFSAFKPLVEDAVSPAPDGSTNRAETSCSGAANYASTLLAVDGVAPADHVILASTAGHGGYRISYLEKGTAWYLNLLAHVTGAHSLNADHAVHALCWLQGENDISYPTSYSTYRAKLEQLQADFEDDVQAATGQTHPVYLLTYQVSYSAQTNKAMALAQLDLAQKSDRFFLATPTYHIPHAADNVHLTAIGYKWIGAYFGRAYAALARGEQPQWLNPRSATVRGAECRVRFDVPQGPMVLDDVNLAVTTDHGFKVLDNGSPATVSAVEVDGRDVVITLSAAPSGPVVVRYGLDYLGTGLSITNGGSGNLRDSTPDVINISGSDRHLWHVCPAFELTAIKLGE